MSEGGLEQAVTITPGSAAGRNISRAALLGPAFVAAIAYVDPGNVATNLTAGIRYRYLLIWVLVAATIMAGIVQYMSAKIGVATGRSLPELLRPRLGRIARICYWAQAELVAMATDMAEVVGGAIALGLLLHIPLALGGLITGGASLILLAVQDHKGQVAFERVVVVFLILIALGVGAGLAVAPPDWPSVARGIEPRFAGTDSVLLAAAMVGATIMPHVIYLHSAAARDRFGRAGDPARFRDVPVSAVIHARLAATRTDVALAMLVAGGVNIAMLLLAASAIRDTPGATTIGGAFLAIQANVGGNVAVLFALALLLSGLASTAVGSYAGAVVMEGLLGRRVPLFARRLVTMVPAVALLMIGAEPTSILVMSQVALSFGIPWALIPLIRVARDSQVMGRHVISAATTATAAAVATLIIILNGGLIWLTATGGG